MRRTVRTGPSSKRALRPTNRLGTGSQIVGQYRDKSSSDRSSDPLYLCDEN